MIHHQHSFFNFENELNSSRNATQSQPVEAHILTRVETIQLRCRTGAQTQRTRIWWNLGVSVSSTQPMQHNAEMSPHKYQLTTKNDLDCLAICSGYVAPLQSVLI